MNTANHPVANEQIDPVASSGHSRQQLISLVFLALLFCLFSVSSRGDDFYESIKFGEHTYRNVRVIEATPVELIVQIDGSRAKIRLKLEELSKDVQTKYQFDPKRAEEIERERAAAEVKNAKLRVQRAAPEIRANTRQFEQQFEARISQLEKDLAQLNRRIDTLQRQARGRPHSEERRNYNRALDLRDQLEKQIGDQRERLRQLRAQHDNL